MYIDEHFTPNFFNFDQSNRDSAAFFVRILLEKCLIEYGSKKTQYSKTEWPKYSVKFCNKKDVLINFSDIQNIFGTKDKFFFTSLKYLLQSFIYDDEQLNIVFNRTKHSPFPKIKEKNVKYYKNLLK